MSPGLEWHTMINQAACADETQHSSDCQFYLTVSESFLLLVNSLHQRGHQIHGWWRKHFSCKYFKHMGAATLFSDLASVGKAHTLSHLFRLLQREKCCWPTGEIKLRWNALTLYSSLHQATVLILLRVHNAHGAYNLALHRAFAVQNFLQRKHQNKGDTVHAWFHRWAELTQQDSDYMACPLWQFLTSQLL